MIELVVPPGVHTAEAFADPDPSPTDLFPAEAGQIERAVDKRRREFTTVRLCARRALADMGVPAVPLVPGEHGGPIWPARVVGSMTHCDGYRAAAVTCSDRLASLGIDAEPHRPLPDGVLRVVASASERRHLDALARIATGTHWDRLLFCTKEAVYKAWSPLTARWLGFLDVEVTIDPADHTFRAALLVPGDCADGRVLTGFEGRWHADDALVTAGVTVPA